MLHVHRLQSGSSEPCVVVTGWGGGWAVEGVHGTSGRNVKRFHELLWKCLKLIWIMPLNRCAPWGIDNFLFLKHLPTAASDGIKLIIQSYQGTWHNQPWHSHTSSRVMHRHYQARRGASQYPGTRSNVTGFPASWNQIQCDRLADDSTLTQSTRMCVWKLKCEHKVKTLKWKRCV